MGKARFLSAFGWPLGGQTERGPPAKGGIARPMSVRGQQGCSPWQSCLGLPSWPGPRSGKNSGLAILPPSSA